MKLNMYVIKSVLGNTYDTTECFTTDTLASCSLVERLQARKMLPNEYQLFNVGTFDNETGEIVVSKPTLVEWDSRRLKEKSLDEMEVKQILKNMFDLK